MQITETCQRELETGSSTCNIVGVSSPISEISTVYSIFLATILFIIFIVKQFK